MSRLAGRITGWDDERGFGFVAPNGGGERSFVHISDFQPGSRRPVDGDLVSYVSGKDARGRMKARVIRHADPKVKSRRPSARFPGVVVGICALMATAAAAAFGVIPTLLSAVYVTLSGMSYFMYWRDKRAAMRDGQRVPENTLHVSDLLGGWPGALMAQQMFRHKTTKASFRVVFWMTVVLNLAGAWWLVSSGTAARIVSSLNGQRF